MLLIVEAGQSDQRPRMAGAERTARHRRLKCGTSTQQPHRLGNRDAVSAEPGRDLLLGQVELVGEEADARRLFNRVQVLPLQVLDQAEDQPSCLVRLIAHQRRHPLQPRQARRAPATLSRQQLVTVGQPAHEHRLQQPVQPDRVGQLPERLRMEGPPQLLVRRLDLVDRDELRDARLASVGGQRDQRLEAPSEAATLGFHHLASTSLASSR